MTRVRRRLCLIVTLVAGASMSMGAAASGAMAGAATAGACGEASGITVVVDFGSAGGGVQIRCAPAPVRSGFEALSKAGFDITNVRSQPGFLCQIDAQPVSDCRAVPSASYYWSYWHADRGAEWIYSTSGGARLPPEGSVEGWSFGASDPPGAAVPGPLAAPTAPPSTPAPAPVIGVPGAAPPAVPSSAAMPPRVTDRLGFPTPTTTGPARDSADADADADADPAVADAELAGADGVIATTPAAGAGSPGGVIAAALVVAGLALLGWRTARRRAHGGPEEG